MSPDLPSATPAPAVPGGAGGLPAATATATLTATGAAADDVYLRNLLDRSEEIIHFKDPEGRYLLVSLGCARRYGLTQREMVGRTDAELIGEADARETRRDDSAILESGRPVVQPPRRERSPRRPDRWLTSSRFPLRSADGAVIGTFGVSRDVTQLVEAEREMARLADETERANAELRRVEAQLRAVLDASTDAIAKYDRHLRYQYINPAGERSRGTTLDLLIGRTDRETGMADTALELWEGALRDVLDTGEPGELEFSVPAADGADAWFHTILTADRDAVGAVVGVLSSTRDITATKRAEQALAHQAMHDPLTGLANRYLLEDRLAHALARMGRSPSLLGLFFVDVDHFKKINDTYGHATGDTVLVEIAHRLRAAARTEDTVARLGGDEFVIVCERLSDPGDARVIADRLVAALSQPVRGTEGELRISVSVGAVLADDAAATPSDLLRSADAAMYRAKEGGRNGFRISGEDGHEQLGSASLEADLRLALDRDELRLVHRPLLSLQNQRVLGLEVQVRWDHPQRGPLPAQDVVAVAERCGLMATLGTWVLEAACAQLASWTHTRGPADPLIMVVDVSARQLRAPGFAAAVRGVLERYSVDPRSLRLQIGEDALLAEGGQVAEVLLAIGELGVEVAVADLGAWLTSLARLPKIAVGVVDAERFAGLTGERELLAAVVVAARGLGMKVVGGGAVSTQRLRELRTVLGEDAQGSFLDRWLSPPEVERLLAADMASRRADGFAQQLSMR